MTATAPVRVERLPDGREVPTHGDAANGATQIAPVGMPAMIDVKALEKALAVIEDPRWLELQKKFANAFDVACKSLLSDNDVQAEGSGENARTFKKKSAWRKLGRHFGVNTRVVGAPTYEVVGKYVIARVTVEGVSSWGHSTEAVGACGTDEEKGRRKITLADAIATAETRATNRAISNLIAMGEVSYEEVAKNEVATAGANDLTLEEAKKYPFPWRKPEKYADKPMGNLSHGMLETVLKAINNEIDKSGETAKRLELRRVCTLLLDDIEERQANGDGVVEEGEQSAGPTTGASDGSSTSTPAGSSESSTNTSSTSTTTTTTPAAGTVAVPATPVNAPTADANAPAYGDKLPPAAEKHAIIPPPPEGASDSIVRLSKRLNELLAHPKFPPQFIESTKRDAKEASRKPGWAHWLREHVEAAEEILAGTLTVEECTAFGIIPVANTKR